MNGKDGGRSFRGRMADADGPNRILRICIIFLGLIKVINTLSASLSFSDSDPVYKQPSTSRRSLSIGEKGQQAKSVHYLLTIQTRTC